jgi:hypothetical protein
MASLTIQPAEDDDDQQDCNLGNGLQAANLPHDAGTLLAGTLFALDVSTYWRPLIRIPLGRLPAMATVSAAAFTLTFDGGAPTVGATYTANRVTRAAWTEAATWNKYDGTNNWTTPGGDYTATNAATVVYASGSVLTFNVLGMLNDALDAGLSYLDLIIRGQEAEGVSNYVVGISSADTTAADRPKLVLTYTVPVLDMMTWRTTKEPLGWTDRREPLGWVVSA